MLNRFTVDNRHRRYGRKRRTSLIHSKTIQLEEPKLSQLSLSTGKKRQRERTAGNYYKRRKAFDYLFMDHQWTSVGIACNEVDTDHKNCFYTGPTITLTIISYAGEHSIVLSMYSSSKIQ